MSLIEIGPTVFEKRPTNVSVASTCDLVLFIILSLKIQYVYFWLY